LRKDEKNYIPLLVPGANRHHCNACADSVARLAIKYMNANQPDSVYALTGANFRSQIPATTWATVSSQLSSLTPFTKVEFVKSIGAVNVYKLTGKILLTYNVSIDGLAKINNFSFVPYQP
jgi:hypothetical protein